MTVNATLDLPVSVEIRSRDSGYRVETDAQDLPMPVGVDPDREHGLLSGASKASWGSFPGFSRISSSSAVLAHRRG